jgi:hypothetical protein
MLIAAIRLVLLRVLPGREPHSVVPRDSRGRLFAGSQHQFRGSPSFHSVPASQRTARQSPFMSWSSAGWPSPFWLNFCK